MEKKRITEVLLLTSARFYCYNKIKEEIVNKI